MHYAGYYINLDGNLGRRQELERQLAACNLQQNYRRHSASLGNALNLKAPSLRPGAVGCFTSHYLLLLARCFFEAGDLETAKITYGRVLELDPMQEMARENLSFLDATVARIACGS